MAQLLAPEQTLPPTSEAQPASKRPTDEGAEAAAKGAKRPCLVHVDSGAIDTLTDGESSGSENSFLIDDASAVDISIHDPGRSAEEVLSIEQLCQRRLDNVRQLKELYEAELLNALEELRSRHSHSHKQATGVEGSSDDPQPAHYKPLRALLAERAGADSTASASRVHLQVQEQTMPSLSEAEEAYSAQPDGSADVSHLQAERQRSRMRLSSIARLEQAASAGTARALDKAGALAMLVSLKGRYLVKRSAVTLGRTTSTHGKVDVDLSPEQFAAKVSRQQARLFLKSDGAFRLANTGRRKFLVNNCQVKRGDTALLPHLSLVEIDNVRLLLMVNHLAVRRLLARSATFGDFPGN